MPPDLGFLNINLYRDDDVARELPESEIRCEITGRPRSVYRKNKLSRIALRELGSKGLVPGLVKSSW